MPRLQRRGLLLRELERAMETKAMEDLSCSSSSESNSSSGSDELLETYEVVSSSRYLQRSREEDQLRHRSPMAVINSHLRLPRIWEVLVRPLG